MNDASKEPMERARKIVAAAKKVMVLSGAGISAESGVPTFRGAGGLWRNHRAMDLATPEAFAADPKLVWEFYQHRREVLMDVVPNAGHRALVALESRRGDAAGGEGFTLVTQNVDGLHQQAGSRSVICLHGDIWIDRCSVCSYEARPRRLFDELPAICPECGSLLRPGVVWFGEPVTAINEAVGIAAEADLTLVVGTSGVVEPAASLARITRQAGGRVIEVNLEETPLSRYADATLLGPSGEVLPDLLR